jgi:hypothetical protein
MMDSRILILEIGGFDKVGSYQSVKNNYALHMVFNLLRRNYV